LNDEQLLPVIVATMTGAKQPQPCDDPDDADPVLELLEELLDEPPELEDDAPELDDEPPELEDTLDPQTDPRSMLTK